MSRLLCSAALGLGLLVAAPAAALTVTVSSLSDIFLASQPNGTVITGYFGSDTAPANSPVRVGVASGAVLTFAANGSTSVDASCFADADGGCYADQSPFSPPPADATYKGPASALIGIFLGNAGFDVASGPASLDYTDPANAALLAYAPTLGQIFFIGDGFDGNGSGTVQQFTAPTGATRLFLAAADSYGSSTGNLGSLAVTITGATVPEPAAWALLIGGFGAIGGAARRRRALAV